MMKLSSKSNRYLWPAILSLFMVLSAFQRGEAFQVGLTVQERAGVSRGATPVTMGVPLPRGTIYSAQDVQIAGLPGQFKSLASWPDGSIKWLLCDFPATVSANGSTVYYLANGMGDASGTPLTANEYADSIVVVTGPLKFVVSTTSFNLFQRLWLDMDGDGIFEANEEMISPQAEDGAVVTDDSDHQFFSARDGDVTVELEEFGPLRLSIVAQGWHRDAGGQRGLDFTVRIHAYSGQSFARVFYTFYNRQSTSIGAYWEPPPPPESYFDVQDISLRSHINLQGSTSYAFGGSGSTVHSGTLSSGQRAYIYAYGTVTPGDLHYLIGGSGSGSGDRARGWADISDSRWGLTTAIRQFWQHHPKGIEVDAGGEVWVRMIPEYYTSFPINPSDPWTAADLVYCGAARTHEVLYYFHQGNYLAANSAQVAKSFENPLYAIASPEYYCATEVFGKMPRRDISLIRPQYRWIVEDWENKVEAMHSTIIANRDQSYWSAKNEYGLWNYGDSYQSEWSNMQYDTPYSLFIQFCRTGDLKYLDLAVDECRHYRDVDIVYHMGTVVPGSLRESFVGSARRLPNTNHGLGYDYDYMGDNSLKGPGLIVHYFFTGDRQSLYGGKMQADYVRNSALRYNRDYIFCEPRKLGMGIEALLAYYEASGDESYLNNGVYHLGDMSSSLQASAYTLVKKTHEFQNISPDHPQEWAIWGSFGCDCDDGLKFESVNYGGCSWQACLAWDALWHYYQITGDAVARDDVLRGIAWMCDTSRTNLWNGSYFYAYDPDYGDWYEGHGKEGAGFNNAVLGFAYEQTGNIDYIDKAISSLDIQVNHCGATTDPKWFAQVTRTIPRFFYYLTEEYGVQDTIPPNPPSGLHVEDATEHSLSLAWTPPPPAADGDGAYSYSIHRDGSPHASSVAAQYEDTGLSENSSHQYAIYSVDNGGNSSTTAATGTFSTLPDTMAPTLSSAHLLSATALEVVYSEPVEETSAENVSHYQIAPGVAIASATLQADLATVRLVTTAHQEGQSYTLTINGVEDRALNPNTIAPNTSWVYQFQLQLMVSEISRPDYDDAYLQVGDQYYIDRTYTIMSMPEDKGNLLWIKTGNNDKMNTQEEFLTFHINIDADVYVGYDHRASSLPHWLGDHFADSGQEVQVTDSDASPLQLWVKHFPAGTVSLGGNMASGASGSSSMYVVLLYAEGSAADTVGPQISNLGVSAIAPTTACVGWTTDEPASSKVEYGLSVGNYPWSLIEAPLVLVHQLDLTGLVPSTLYHYRAISQDQFGNTTVSQDRTFTTQTQDVTPPEISQVRATAIAASSAEILWSTDEPSDSQVEYGLSISYGLLSPVDTTLALSHQVPLSGLLSGTLYHYRVISRDQSGNTATSGDQIFSTASTDTTAPHISQIMALVPTDSTAVISWATDELSDSQVEYGYDTGYGFLSLQNPNLVLSHQVAIDLPHSVAKATVPMRRSGALEMAPSRRGGDDGTPGDLSPGDEGTKETVVYHFRVRSQDAWGNLAISGDGTFAVNLGDITPPQIFNFQVSEIMDTSAQVGWETDEPSRAKLYYGLQEGQYSWSAEDSTLALVHWLRMEDLVPHTTYHLQAWCQDAAENWTASDDTTVVTKYPLPKQPGKPQHWDD